MQQDENFCSALYFKALCKREVQMLGMTVLVRSGRRRRLARFCNIVQKSPGIKRSQWHFTKPRFDSFGIAALNLLLQTTKPSPLKSRDTFQEGNMYCACAK